MQQFGCLASNNSAFVWTLDFSAVAAAFAGLSSSIVRLQIKTYASDVTPLAEIIATYNGTSQTVQFSAAQSVVAGCAGTLYFDFRVEGPLGEFLLVYGTMTFVGGVTTASVAANSAHDATLPDTVSVISVTNYAGPLVQSVSISALNAILASCNTAAASAASSASTAASIAATNWGVFRTKTAFLATSIAAGATAILLLGIATPGDCEPLVVVKISTPSPVKPWHMQTADGAYWVMSAGSEVDARWFGTDPTGATDSSTALNNALSFARTIASRVHVVSGLYQLQTALSMTGADHMFGDGIVKTVLYPVASINGIVVNSMSPVVIRDLAVQYQTQGNSSTYAIYVVGPSTPGNTSTIIRDIQILYSNSGIYVGSSVAFVIDNAKIIAFSTVGIYSQNTFVGDAGDSSITNCYIQGGNSAYSLSNPTAGIYFFSQGALRVTNNAILNVLYGFDCALTAALVTRQLTIANNSFDGMTYAAISFTRSGTTGAYGGAMIVGNVFNLATIGVQVPYDANGVWMTGMQIVGNNYFDSSAATCVFVYIRSTAGFVVANNTVQSTVATTISIVTGAETTNGVVGPNPKVGTFAANQINGGVTTIAPN